MSVDTRWQKPSCCPFLATTGLSYSLNAGSVKMAGCADDPSSPNGRGTNPFASMTEAISPPGRPVAVVWRVW